MTALGKLTRLYRKETGIGPKQTHLAGVEMMHKLAYNIPYSQVSTTITKLSVFAH
jgi:hypothetical protein